MDDYITLTVDSDVELSLGSDPADHSDSDSDDHDLWQLDLFKGEETTLSTPASLDLTTATPGHQGEEGLTSSLNQPCQSTEGTDSSCSITKETKRSFQDKRACTALDEPFTVTPNDFHGSEQTVNNSGRSASASEQGASTIRSGTVTDLRDRLSRKNSGDLRDKLNRQRRTRLLENDLHPKLDAGEELDDSPKERQVIVTHVLSVTPFSSLDQCNTEGEQGIIVLNSEIENRDTKAENSSSFQNVGHDTLGNGSRDVSEFVREIRLQQTNKDSNDICQEAADVSQHCNVPESSDCIESFDLCVSMADKKHNDAFSRHKPVQNRGKRKSDRSQSCSDRGEKDSCVTQGPKKQRISRDANNFCVRNRDEEDQHGALERHGRGKRSMRPWRGRHHNQSYESYHIFVGKCFEKSPGEWDPDNLCMFLAQNGNHLTQALMEFYMRNRDITDRLISLLRVAFLESSKLCSSCRCQIMGMLKNCGFFESRPVISTVKSLMSTRYRSPDEHDTTVAGHLLDLVKAMTEAHVLLKEDTVVLLGSLQAVLRTERIVVKEEDLSKPLMEKARAIEDTYFQPGSTGNSECKSGSDSAEGDGDCLVPILPIISDIRSRRHTGLVPRNVSEPFSSATEYIGYVYLSFREDFIGPLCKGIQDYIKYAKYQKKHPHKKKEKFWNQDVRLYENVKVLDTALSNETGIDVTIRIDVSRFRNFSSRLIYGSLVCLSHDEFQSVIYAVVSNREVETLRDQGVLNIHLLDVQGDESGREEIQPRSHGLALTEDDEGHSERFQGLDEKEMVQVIVNKLQGHSVIMLESTAFYEAYVHSLQSLKTFHSHLATRQSSLPFKKQLLQMSKTMSAPRYLEASSGQVSFQCMMKYSPNEEENNLKKQLVETQCALFRHKRAQSGTASDCSDEFQRQLEERERKLIQDRAEQRKVRDEKYTDNRVCEPGSWPAAAELGLDDSQYAALRLALTREVALIQGPPGTGKTTLGIRIAELLLENTHLWRRDKNGLLEKTPLLLLSYTNHALDQFLTELLRLPILLRKACHHVVRVGSRSEQEMLFEHNITSLRQATRMDMDLRNEKQMLEQCRNSIEHLDQQIQSYKDGIVHPDHLWREGVMADAHYQSLASKCGKGVDPMVMWLCLDRDDFGQSLNQNDSFFHGSSLEKNRREERKGKLRGKQRQADCSDSQGTGSNPEIKSKNQSVCAVRSDNNMDVGEGNTAKEGMESEVSNVSISDKELMEYEDEMDLELEQERRLYIEGFSEEESESVESAHPSTSTPQEYEMTPEEGEFDDDRDFREGETHVMLISIFEKFNSWLFPEHFSFFFLQRVVSKIEHEVNNDDIMTKEDAGEVADIWHLDVQQRWRLYRFWLKRLLAPLQDQRQWEENRFREVSKRKEELRRFTDLHIMKKASVVAMTTTGAARYAAVLHELGPRIILVEEAAQVPEAHLLSSLSPACQHLIMIGDHQQLRPSYTNYDLTASRGRHHIDISLFERLCRAGVPFQRLALQHRMQPNISALLVPTIYPELNNHPSVCSYPGVKGVKVNFFFLTHDQPEDMVEESRSKRNTHEAKFLASLYLYLRLQGYSEKDITVLATYKDQVLLLRALIKEEEKDTRLPPPIETLETCYRRGRPKRPAQKVMGARVTAVDNFQGEESRIILLSLVRSNKRENIGYLKEDNRVCVALSRAKEGMFVIGNCSMLSKASPECWKPILDKAEKSGHLGTALPLYCQAHDRITPVSCHTDIEEKCKNGGCSERCDYRRECGHTCDKVCHSSINLHDQPCNKPCVRRCPSGHLCSGRCWQQPCPPCLEKCERHCSYGHLCQKKCGQTCWPCQERCELTLPCGHSCQARCGLVCTTECLELEKVQGVCGHEFQDVCYKKRDGTASCKVPCSAILDCQHPCSGKCGTCFAGRLHVACREDCKHILVCGHEYKGKCSQSCPPCERKCEAKCVHSQKSCNRRCGEKCQECIEPCAWQCQSKKCKNKYRCSKLCWEMCDRPRCDQPCSSWHRCESCKKRYECRGLSCPEPCPPACPDCNADIFECFFGEEDESDAKFYKMPDCRCVLEVGGLDRYMDMLVAAEGDSGKVRPVVCPKCSSPVVTALRYGNIIKKTKADIERVKKRLLATERVQLKNKQYELQGRLYEVYLPSGDHVHKWKQKTVQRISNACSVQELAAPENQINFLTAINRLRQKVPVGSTPENKDICLKLKRHLECLENWVIHHHSQQFSQQQLTQFQVEMARTDLTVAFCMADNRLHEVCVNDVDKAKMLETTQTCLQRLLSNTAVLSRKEEENLRESINSMKDKLSAGLGISQEEKVMIVKAMGFQKGHWFKCKNGHIYCITECGGAMQESQCPDCGEGIGGGQHRLRDDNALASEMDGATHAAWSEQANLGNYQFL